jgi:hypothetical protein
MHRRRSPFFRGIFLDRQALFADLFDMYAAAFKEMRDNNQAISKESG